MASALSLRSGLLATLCGSALSWATDWDKTGIGIAALGLSVSAYNFLFKRQARVMPAAEAPKVEAAREEALPRERDDFEKWIQANKHFSKAHRKAILKAYHEALQSQGPADAFAGKLIALRNDGTISKDHAHFAFFQFVKLFPDNSYSFGSWLQINKHFSEKQKKKIASIYLKAQGKDNPFEYFQNKIAKLEAQGFIDGRQAQFLVKEFEQINPPEFDHEKWAARFKKATHWTQKVPLLKEIREGSEKAKKDGYYWVKGKKVVFNKHTIRKMKEGTCLFNKAPKVDGKKPHKDIVIKVRAGDVIDSAIRLKRKGMNPVFINMANAYNPGGGYKWDQTAQEENAFRRSFYQESLGQVENPEFYKRSDNMQEYRLPRGGGAYTPYLPVFRGNEASGYPFLEEPEVLAAIAVAAPDLRTHKDRPLPVEPGSRAHKDLLDKTIDAYLSIAYKKGHDAVVLSALGCGAFQNDPKLVAKRFLKVLQKDKWQGKFKAVYFAIYDDGHGPNLATFKKYLHNKKVGQKG